MSMIQFDDKKHEG